MAAGVYEEQIDEGLPPDLSADAILAHLSHGKTYLEIDEPDGFVSLEGGEWEVARKRRGSFVIIGRFTNFKQAMACAVTPDIATRNELRKKAPYPFCSMPEKCIAASRCKRDPCCNN